MSCAGIADQDISFLYVTAPLISSWTNVNGVNVVHATAHSVALDYLETHFKTVASPTSVRRVSYVVTKILDKMEATRRTGNKI